MLISSPKKKSILNRLEERLMFCCLLKAMREVGQISGSFLVGQLLPAEYVMEVSPLMTARLMQAFK